MLISQIGLLESIQNQDHRIIPGCPGNPYRFIHTKCPLSQEKASESGAWLKFAVIDPTGYPRNLIQRACQKEWPHTLLEPCGRMLRFG